jgi:hypothetical protein
MPLPDNTIRHLSHSSFLVKLDGLTPIFDYALDDGETGIRDSLETGVIRPEALAGEAASATPTFTPSNALCATCAWRPSGPAPMR